MKEQHQRQLGAIIIWIFIFGFLFHLLLLFFYRDLLFYEYFPTEIIFPKIEIISKLSKSMDVKKYSIFMFNNTILFFLIIFISIVIPVYRFRKSFSFCNIKINQIPISLFFIVLVLLFTAFLNRMIYIFNIRTHTGLRVGRKLIDFETVNIDSYLNREIIASNAFCYLYMSFVLIVIIASFLENKVFFNSFRETKS